MPGNKREWDATTVPSQTLCFSLPICKLLLSLSPRSSTWVLSLLSLVCENLCRNLLIQCTMVTCGCLSSSFQLYLNLWEIFVDGGVQISVSHSKEDDVISLQWLMKKKKKNILKVSSSKIQEPKPGSFKFLLYHLRQEKRNEWVEKFCADHHTSEAGQAQSNSQTKAVDISWQMTWGFMWEHQAKRHRSGFSGFHSKICGCGAFRHFAPSHELSPAVHMHLHFCIND